MTIGIAVAMPKSFGDITAKYSKLLKLTTARIGRLVLCLKYLQISIALCALVKTYGLCYTI